jgi:hypothetical protein
VTHCPLRFLGWSLTLLNIGWATVAVVEASHWPSGCIGWSLVMWDKVNFEYTLANSSLLLIGFGVVLGVDIMVILFDILKVIIHGDYLQGWYCLLLRLLKRQEQMFSFFIRILSHIQVIMGSVSSKTHKRV